MIGVDTNVLVRFLVRDDEAQFEQTRRLINREASRSEPVFVWMDSSAKFADCLINAHHRSLGCRATATFDTKALQLSGLVAA